MTAKIVTERIPEYAEFLVSWQAKRRVGRSEIWFHCEIDARLFVERTVGEDFKVLKRQDVVIERRRAAGARQSHTKLADVG